MKNLSLPSILQKAYLLMKTGLKTIPIQKYSLTLEHLKFKIKLWEPLSQITYIDKTMNFKYSLKYIKQNIKQEFFTDIILYIAVRQLWWIFDFSQSSKDQQKDFQTYIQFLNKCLKEQYYHINMTLFSKKIYLSQLLILIASKIVSRFFSYTFPQLQSGIQFQSQVYIELNKILIGIEMGPKAYQVHLKKFKKNFKEKQNYCSERKTIHKQGTLIRSQNKKLNTILIKKQQSSNNKIKTQKLITEINFKNLRYSKGAAKIMLIERSKRKHLAGMYKSIEDEQQLLFKEQLKKSLEVAPLPQMTQKKFLVSQMQEQYLNQQNQKAKKSIFFRDNSNSIGFLEGKSPQTYQKQIKKKCLSLQRLSSVMNHELSLFNYETHNVKQRKVSFKPQNYSNHYEVVKDLSKKYGKQIKAKKLPNKLFKSSKIISAKFLTPNSIKRGNTFNLENQFKADQMNQKLTKSRHFKKIEDWIKIVNDLKKKHIQTHFDSQQLVSLYQRKLAQKANISYLMMRRFQQMKKLSLINENQQQMKKRIQLFCGNLKQEQQRQLFVNLITIAPQKNSQLDEQREYGLKKKSLNRMNSRQLIAQRQAFIQICNNKKDLYQDFKKLISSKNKHKGISILQKEKAFSTID